MKRKIFNTLVLFMIAFSSIAQNNKIKIDYAQPKKYEIGGITISGVKYLDENVLIQLSGLKIGQIIELPGSEISNAIKKLWKHGLFGNVGISVSQIKDEKIYLNFELEERHRLSKINFHGVSKSQADDLEEEVNIVRGTQITNEVLNTTKNRIRKYYVEKGFYNVETEILQKEDSVMPNTLILDVNITKNKRVKIEEIEFIGNTVLKPSKLRRAMKETKRKAWYNMFKPSKYIENKYADDKKKIIAKYNEKGYRDAEIVHDTVYPISDNRLKMEIKINEGKLYYFRNIEWIGNTKYPSEFLEQQLGIEKGDVFDQGVLDKRLSGAEDAVSGLYLDNGYLFFRAIPVEKQIENDSIDLEIRIFEGEQARINNITITGNTRTNEHVVRRELWTYPGELFSRADIIRTHRELASLGYFNAEKIDVIPKPNPVDGTVDIEYIVEESPSDQIEVSGGWGGNMVIATVGLVFNNFSLKNIFNLDTYTPLPSGDGQKLALRAQTNGKFYQSYSLSFTEPWLGGKKRNSFTVSIFHSIQTASTYWNLISDKNMKVTGASVGLGRRLSWPDTYFTLYNDVSYRRYELNDFYKYYFAFQNGISHSLSFTTIFSRNSISQPLYPRYGANISLTLQFTPPYSLFKKDNFWELSADEKNNINNDNNIKNKAEKIVDREKAIKYKLIEFHKWKFKSEWYMQIVDKLVLRTNIEFGYLGYYNKNYGDSPFESFQLGGDGMSGFQHYYGTDVIPLRGYDNGNNNRGSLTVQPQANLYDKFTLEIRYPITLKPAATIYALAFLEAGNTWNKIGDFNPFKLHRSAGVGLRFFLPMFGLLGIDWGYGFDDIPYQPKSSRGHFAFTIGQQF